MNWITHITFKIFLIKRSHIRTLFICDSGIISLREFMNVLRIINDELKDDKRLTGQKEVKMGNAKCNCDKIEGPCHSYWEPGWMTECVWMKQKSGIAHNCTASCWRAQLSTNRGALRTFLPLVIPQWASAHLTVHQRSRFYKLHSDLVTITRQHSVSWKISVTSVVSKR